MSEMSSVGVIWQGIGDGHTVSKFNNINLYERESKTGKQTQTHSQYFSKDITTALGHPKQTTTNFPFVSMSRLFTSEPRVNA